MATTKNMFSSAFGRRGTHTTPPRAEEKSSQLTRLRPCCSDSANLAQQTVEIVISGYDSRQKAESAFRCEMVKLIEEKTNGLVADASTR